jgi:TRAP-type C4-dicarboxylate transport system permease small subunit
MQPRSIGSVALKLSLFIERLAAYPCIAATGAMTVVVLLGVLFRYVLLSPLSWSEEVARYLTKFGYYMALEGQTQLSPVLAKYKINMMWSLSAIPIAGALAMIQTVLQILIDLFRSKEDSDINSMVDI